LPIACESPVALTTSVDGSLWVADQNVVPHPNNSIVRHLVQENGNWIFKEALDIPWQATALTTGKDGAIWVASRRQSSFSGGYRDGTVRRIAKGENGTWSVQGQPISVDIDARALTVGLDGSIWVACDPDTGSVQRIVEFEDGTWNVLGAAIAIDKSPQSLTTGVDGSIWVSNYNSTGSGPGSVQRIVNEHGQWFVKGSAISVDSDPKLTTGLDGSIWVGSKDYGTVQHIVNKRGGWFVQGDAIKVGDYAAALTTGLDGSIWVAVRDDSAPSLQQLWTNPVAPTALTAVADPAAGKATLSWTAPVADGGTPVTSYAVTARQGATIQTKTNRGDTAYTFSGLDFSKGPIYFTVAATNFAGTSPVATLLVGQDGQPIDTTHLTTGITTDGTPVIGGGFDTVGYTYSWQALGSGAGVSNGKATFTFGLPNQPQTIVAAGQEIAVTQGAFGSINLAGAAAYYGAQPNVAFKLDYTDGSTETWTQSISDWAQQRQYAGETTLVTSQYRNQGDGTRDSRPVYLYSYSRAIPQGKTLKSITLPTNQNVRILDIKMGT